MATDFKIPSNIFRAVALAQSKKPERYYLNGVFVEPGAVTATDGEVLISYKMETGLPEGHAGHIVHVDMSEKGFKAKTLGELVLSFNMDSAIVEFFDSDNMEKRVAVCGFSVVDGTFLDYRRITPDRGMCNDFHHIVVDPDKLAIFGKADKILRGDVRDAKVGLTFGETSRSPAFVHIGGNVHSEHVCGAMMLSRKPY